jgi:hypothetical protein
MLSRLLVHPLGRMAVVTVAQLAPDLLRNIARSTRIPERRLIRANLPAK